MLFLPPCLTATTGVLALALFAAMAELYGRYRGVPALLLLLSFGRNCLIISLALLVYHPLGLVWPRVLAVGLCCMATYVIARRRWKHGV